MGRCPPWAYDLVLDPFAGSGTLGRSAITNYRKYFLIDQNEKGKEIFLSNNAGGIIGGISSGQEIIVRFCVKPTSSILSSRKTIDKNMNEVEISTKGRHEPCVGIRAVPVGEAMMATTIADHCLRFL